ncbi:MAG TPA: RNA-binding protein [Gemmataceae bacterium]|nr:RNA-binding protein [Gemmataceae bacterium]
MFEEFGAVQSAQIIIDHNTGGSKGFGFVEISSNAEAQAAIDALNGKNVDGRYLTVNEARSREGVGGGGRGGGGDEGRTMPLHGTRARRAARPRVRPSRWPPG